MKIWKLHTGVHTIISGLLCISIPNYLLQVAAPLSTTTVPAEQGVQAEIAEIQVEEDVQAQVAEIQVEEDVQAQVAEIKVEEDVQAQVAKIQVEEDVQAQVAKIKVEEDVQAQVAKIQVEDVQPQIATPSPATVAKVVRLPAAVLCVQEEPVLATTLQVEQEVQPQKAEPLPTTKVGLPDLGQYVWYAFSCMLGVGTDIALLYHYYSTHKDAFFRLTLAFVLLAAIFTSMFAFLSYVHDWKTGKKRSSAIQWAARGVILILGQAVLMRLVKH